eukprot:Ihof_evm11s132 gene=Ihof_evmTU11s132
MSIAEGSGNIWLAVRMEDTASKVVMENVLFFPDLQVSLFPIAMLKGRVFRTIFEDKKVTVFMTSKDSTNNEEDVSNGKGLKKVQEEEKLGLLAYEVYHSIFMHPSPANMFIVLAMSNNPGVDKKNKECRTCSMFKTKRIPYSEKTDRATKVLQGVHSDLAGPLTKSYSGYQYVVTFTNKHSHYVCVYLLKKMSDTFATFKRYYVYATAMHDKPMGVLVTDNGTEYLNLTFSPYLDKFEIYHQTTVPNHPEQNGLSKSMNQTLFTMGELCQEHTEITIKEPRRDNIEKPVDSCHKEKEEETKTREDTGTCLLKSKYAPSTSRSGHRYQPDPILTNTAYATTTDNLYGQDVPRSVCAAMNSPQRHHWEAAMQQEMKVLADNVRNV